MDWVGFVGCGFVFGVEKMRKVEVSFEDLKKGCDRVLVRRFLDMKDRFGSVEGVRGNPVIYRVFVRDFGWFEMGLTVLEAGNVGGEFFMTKGHKHKKPLDEVYVLLKGKVKLLLQENRARVFDMKKGKVYFVPGRSGHRLINVGKGRAEVLTIYSKDVGYDYDFEFERRIVKSA